MLDDGGESLQLDARIDHDRADADLHGTFELGDRLVVAVQAEAGGVGARGERDGQLAAGGDVDGEAFLGDPAHDLGREERLAGVVDARLHAAARGRVGERFTHFAGAAAHGILVEHVQRSSETGTQLGDADARDLELAVGITRGRGRPHQRREHVRIGRFGEPRGHERAVGGGGHVRNQSCGVGLPSVTSRPAVLEV